MLRSPWSLLLVLVLGTVVSSARAEDLDGDGVDDANDVCCNTPAGVPVNSTGRPVADLDSDCDVDIADYAILQNSLAGPGGEGCCSDSECDDQDPCTNDACDPVKGCLHLPNAGTRPLQSSTIALTCDSAILVNVNPDANTISIFDATQAQPNKLAEVPVGREPRSVAVFGRKAYVANAFDGSVSIVDLNAMAVTNTIPIGVEPMAITTSPNGTWVFVANSASNSLTIIDPVFEFILGSVELAPYGTAPRAIAVTNDGDTDDLDETVFVAMFYGELRPGKTSLDEGQDDQREGRVVAISTESLAPLGEPNPIVLGPLANTGFNSNGRLAPATGQVPSIASTNPQTFTTPTGAFPNQLAAIALHPTTSRGYVVSTGASPNGPLRFNSMVQGLVSVFDTATRTEVTAAQTDATVRRTAPLNLNQGVNLENTALVPIFLSNPVAMAWRPDGSDAWVVVQNSDVLVRLTVDGAGIPTIGAPLAVGPGSVVRADLFLFPGGPSTPSIPQGIVINGAGTRAYVSNFVARSVATVDITNGTVPVVVGLVQSSDLPAPGSDEAVAQLGAALFYTGRGRMSSESWGGCIVCHPNGRSDNITWMFDAGPRQTIPLDGMFSKTDPTDQRILNWSAVRDENHDFELNTRGVFGGRGLIDDDRLFYAIAGTAGATPTDPAVIEQFNQATNAVETSNFFTGAPIPTAFVNRREFASATLPDGRVYIIGGRTGAGTGSLVIALYSVMEYNPRTNVLALRSSTGFTRRHSLGAAAVRTADGLRIYAIGGYTGVTGAEAPSNVVEEYNPETNTWRTVTSLPTAVAQFGITTAGGINAAEPLQLVHVVSGNTGSEDVPSLINPGPVQRFQADPAGPGTWTSFNPVGLTLRRNHGAATALRGVSSRVFVIGGHDSAGTVLDSVEEYVAQPVTVVTSPHTALPEPRARFGIGSSLSTNQIYVAGGVNGAGGTEATIFEYTIAANGAVPGPAGTPSGTWTARTPLLQARRGLQLSTPPGVTNFLTVQSAGRDARQDAMSLWIAKKVRPSHAPFALDKAAVMTGRELFAGCASCHGGEKWTRSTVDYSAPPSPEVGIGLGNERVVGAELRQTLTQGASVLNNVGTFTLGGGRTNEIRPNGADISQAINPLGGNGLNIPSLLSVHETAPYFYSGLAQTLEEVLNGSQDEFGGTRHHFVSDDGQRAALIAFLRSIDETTPIFP